MTEQITRGTQDAPDAATAHLLSLISDNEDAIVALVKLRNPNVNEAELRTLLAGEGEGENLDYLLQESVRNGLRGSLEKQRRIDERTGG